MKFVVVFVPNFKPDHNTSVNIKSVTYRCPKIPHTLVKWQLQVRKILTVEFLVEVSPWRHRQGPDELFKLDGTILQHATYNWCKNVRVGTIWNIFKWHVKLMLLFKASVCFEQHVTNLWHINLEKFDIFLQEFKIILHQYLCHNKTQQHL